MLRLTKNIRQELLDKNEGFTLRTSYESRNYQADRIYKISGGKLYIREIGDTSWSDSNFDEEHIATDDEVHSFLYKYLDRLNTEGIG